MTSMSPTSMTVADLRYQITENIRFLHAGSRDVLVIITREPIGTYKAIGLRVNFTKTKFKRDVVVSSDGFDTVIKALEHLLIKSADAVQQYIITNGFDQQRPSPDGNDLDDTSVVSCGSDDEPEKDRLADSSMSLESEAQSVYSENASEDDDGTVRSFRTWTPARLRSYDARSARRESSRSHSRSRSRSRSPERAPAYRKVPPPPVRYGSAHPDPAGAHFDRAAYWPFTGRGPWIDDYPVRGGIDTPRLAPNFAMHPMHPPPPPPPMGRPRDLSWPDPKGMDTVRFGAAPADSRGVHWQRALEHAHRNHASHASVNMDYSSIDNPGPKAPVSSPSTMPPFGPAVSGISSVGAGDQFSPPSPGSLSGVPWASDHQIRQQQQYVRNYPDSKQPVSFLPEQKRPVKVTRIPGDAAPAASYGVPGVASTAPSIAPSTAPSVASSTPTIEVVTAPEAPAPSALGAQAIDYRLVIKTAAGAPTTQLRIMARTPPTKADIIATACRFVAQNKPRFRAAGLRVDGGASVSVRVTRAVFGEGSYDLSAYPDNDLSRLCETMRGVVGPGGEEATSGGAASGLPLFEVVVGNVD